MNIHIFLHFLELWIVKNILKSLTIRPMANYNTYTDSRFYHINYSSIFWGLVDDMVIQVQICNPASNTQNNILKSNYDSGPGDPIEQRFAIQIQSQLRIGSSDMGVNQERVARFYKCLNSNIDERSISDRGSLCQVNNPTGASPLHISDVI